VLIVLIVLIVLLHCETNEARQQLRTGSSALRKRARRCMKTARNSNVCLNSTSYFFAVNMSAHFPHKKTTALRCTWGQADSISGQGPP
jgi:hypothetical protein